MVARHNEAIYSYSVEDDTGEIAEGPFYHSIFAGNAPASNASATGGAGSTSSTGAASSPASGASTPAYVSTASTRTPIGKPLWVGYGSSMNRSYSAYALSHFVYAPVAEIGYAGDGSSTRSIGSSSTAIYGCETAGSDTRCGASCFSFFVTRPVGFFSYPPCDPGISCLILQS